MTQAERVPVLVVGAGVAGLSTSLFLAQQGVSSLLVERRDGTSIHPRARGVNGRTMELMRELGLADEIRAAGERLAPAVGIYSGSSLIEVLEREGDGGWLMRKARARAMRGHASKRSPTGPCRCTQDVFEPILLRAAYERGVDVRFATELLSFEQDAAGVTASLRNGRTGAEYLVRAAYLVGADGSRSPVRSHLGLPRSGSRTFGHQINILFRADLGPLVRGRELSMCLIENESVHGLLASIDNESTWCIHVSYDPDRGERPEAFTPERCEALVRAAVGIADMHVVVLGVSPWQSAVRVAERYRQGRVFLAGDAAHAMPPWGGFGANTAIQDAHNLAWKLGLVLAGVAHEELLDTYESERLPVGRAVAEIAGRLNGDRGLMAISKGLRGLRTLWTMRHVFPYLTMGYGYDSSAVILEPGTRPGPGTATLDGRPGTRVPHAWLVRDGERISTLDLVRGRFVLLAGPDADEWCAAAGVVASRFHVPIACERVPEALRDLGLRRNGALLVRPDGIVAWRARSSGPGAELGEAMAKLLGVAAPARPPRAMDMAPQASACDQLGRRVPRGHRSEHAQERPG